MRSINRVILIGHIATDPEFRKTAKGHRVAHFSLATNYDTTIDGEKKQYADFHRLTAWGPLAETADKWLKKGMAVYIEGRLHNSSFEAKDGQKKTVTEVIIDTLNILKWGKTAEGVEEVQAMEPEGVAA